MHAVFALSANALSFMTRLKYIYKIFLCTAILCGFVLPDIAQAFPIPSEMEAPKKRKRKSKKKKRRNNRNRRSTKKAVALPPEVVSYDSLTLLVNDVIMRALPENVNPGGLRVNSVKTDSRWNTAQVKLNESFTYLPITRELIEAMRDTIITNLPDSLRDYKITLHAGNHQLAYYVNQIDKLPIERRRNPSFVKAAHPYATPTKGLDNDIVALWHSHGRYFKPGSGAWTWQRPFLFETAEDLFTMSFILPYVVPMLENAGAYVMLPRERDTNRNEVIVDNDLNPGGNIFSQPFYKEESGLNKWQTGAGEGFIYDLHEFRDTENPFEVGTYREVTTVRNPKDASAAAWYADMPADGEYAVYVSYKSLPNSTTDAHYAVNYSGGTREFIVNQQMGGGTWIYLGTFPFKKGYSDSRPIVTLTNLSANHAAILTADAVKIGGGMGNIARSNRRSDVFYEPSTPQQSEAEQETGEEEEEEEESEEEEETINEEESEKLEQAAPVFRTSGMPRFVEGARYWLQWAGAPESVYSPYHGSDDYKDDYTSRGEWVNWLLGGSPALPSREGLKIPVDVAMALHSDAGKRSDDSFVGTLGIYFTNDGACYSDGTPRINSRMLADLIMRQITADIRQKHEPAWTRRAMWDKSYVEARVPEIPTCLIELLSHQNFADMQYGLDPEFKHTVGRAIYKGIGRFLAERKGREFVAQPLAIKDFMITRKSGATYRLAWQPTPDPLENTAMPQSYVVFERNQGDLGFHKIGETAKEYFDVKVTDNEIHSFRIVAVNEGGMSFPSETLAIRHVASDKYPVLIVNGFTRISAPGHFSSNGRAGFDSELDFGVPYMKDISFTGYQMEFNRNAGERFGRSASNYAAQVIAGNTFDYTALHGEGVATAGKGFVSCSVGAVIRGAVKLGDYRVVDLILGKQKATVQGRGSSGIKHRAFPTSLQKEIEMYLQRGGRLLVSGEYVASDLYGTHSSDNDSIFASGVLGIAAPDSIARTRSGRMISTGYSDDLAEGSYDFSSNLNEQRYIVENPDNLVAANPSESNEVFAFPDNNGVAALRMKGRNNSRKIIMSIPIESIIDDYSRNAMIRTMIKWLTD